MARAGERRHFLILNFYLAMNVHGTPDIARAIQVGIPLAQEHQKRRQSAPPLPTFPEEPADPPVTEYRLGPRKSH